MSNNTHESNNAIITERSKTPIIVSNMDGVLVNKTFNASIDNANRIGNVHQYFTKSLLIIITTKFRFIDNGPYKESFTA